MERLNAASENVVTSKPVMLACDGYEKALEVGSSFVNKMLPAEEAEQSNGFPHEKAPESAAARPRWLATETYWFLSDTAKRMFGKAQSCTDSLLHYSAKKTL